MGLARTFAPLVHLHGAYDLDIDWAASSPSEGAAQITGFLAGGQPRLAFARLAARYAAEDFPG